MRLIDGDRVEKILRDMANEEDNQNTATSWANALNVFADMISDAPNSDMEEIVKELKRLNRILIISEVNKLQSEISELNLKISRSNMPWKMPLKDLLDIKAQLLISLTDLGEKQ